MAFWFNRYKNYTKRGEVYLFTLKDYCEIMLIKQFGGCYLVRKDMPMKAGYLMQFPADQVARLTAFVKNEIAFSSDDPLVVGSKIFQLTAIDETFEGDGNTAVIQIATKPLTTEASDFVVTVTAEGVTTTLTPTISEGVVTLKNASNVVKATIYTADGLMKFGANPSSPTAPAAGEVWNIQAKEIAFKLNYQLLGNTLYAGLSAADAPKEIALSDVDLGADGTNKVFQTHANLKPSSISISLTPTGDEATEVTGIEDDGKGNLKKSSTTYGTIDYVSGEMTLEAAPAALSFSATYYEAQ